MIDEEDPTSGRPEIHFPVKGLTMKQHSKRGSEFYRSLSCREADFTSHVSNVNFIVLKIHIRLKL